MQVHIKLTSKSVKFLEYIRPNGIRIKKEDEIGMQLLAYMKYPERYDEREHPELIYKYIVRIPDAMWYQFRLKRVGENFIDSSFENYVRKQFYQFFFNYMNFKILDKIVKRNRNFQIKLLIADFMKELSLSDNEISLETLIRNYHRYRANPDVMINSFIDFIRDEYSKEELDEPIIAY